MLDYYNKPSSGGASGGGGGGAYGAGSYQSNRTYPAMGQPIASGKVLANYVFYAPFVPREDVSVDGIVFVRDGGAANVRVGIYDTSASTGMPDALLAQAEHTTAGFATIIQAIAEQALTKDELYWLALTTDTSNIVSGGDPINAPLASESGWAAGGMPEGVSLAARTVGGNLQVSKTYGSLSDPAYTTGIGQPFEVPLIGVRVV